MCVSPEQLPSVLHTTLGKTLAVCETEVELESIPTTACLTVCPSSYALSNTDLLRNAQLLWQYGDRHYHAKRWTEAADWFIAGSHKLFKANSPTTSAKCFRKAALCYIEQREYARASVVIRRCPDHEAKTHYVIFLTAVHQGTLRRWMLHPIMTSPLGLADEGQALKSLK